MGTCTDIEEVISNITYTICWNVCFFNVNIITGNLAIKGGSLHTKKRKGKKNRKKILDYKDCMFTDSTRNFEDASCNFQIFHCLSSII